MWERTDKNELVNLNNMILIYVEQRGTINDPTYRIVGKTIANNIIILRESKDKKRIDKMFVGLKNNLLPNQKEKAN